MISIKLSFKWGMYQTFLLTLVFDRKGELGQIGSSQTPCKILTLALKLKNRPVDPFKVPIIKAEYAKKMFLEGISQLSILV